MLTEEQEKVQAEMRDEIRYKQGSSPYNKMKKDAERYRFLRAQHKDPEGDFTIGQWDERIKGWESVEDLDAAIDKAMEKSRCI